MENIFDDTKVTVIERFTRGRKTRIGTAEPREWRLFCEYNRDGNKILVKTIICRRPDLTKAYKFLRTMIGRIEITSVGYTCDPSETILNDRIR